MPRAPFEVLVYPVRRSRHEHMEYALLKRADAGFWQGIAGGGEDDEAPLEAARREAWEEAGIPADSKFLPLDTVESIPVTEFKESPLWGDEVYVIPQHSFGVLVSDSRLVLSHEHTDYGWFSYQEAHRLVQFDGNKTALWELDRRLAGGGPRNAESSCAPVSAQEMIHGVDVVFIHSPCPELADWYGKTLGLEIGFSEGGWVEYHMGGSARFAVEHVGAPRSEVEAQALVVSFRVTDIHQAVETLAARGVRFYPSPATAIFQAGASLVATFQDPAGHWVQLSQRLAVGASQASVSTGWEEE